MGRLYCRLAIEFPTHTRQLVAGEMEALQGHAKAGLHCKFLLITVEDKWMLDRLPTLPGLP